MRRRTAIGVLGIPGWPTLGCQHPTPDSGDLIPDGHSEARRMVRRASPWEEQISRC
ncbi:hypothetical protein [Nocardia fluminea]|uniref:hypothetical protein n=1 Tax=Nocardia fluminea TaxID=134984 RepID=UPI003D09A830